MMPNHARRSFSRRVRTRPNSRQAQSAISTIPGSAKPLGFHATRSCSKVSAASTWTTGPGSTECLGTDSMSPSSTAVAPTTTSRPRRTLSGRSPDRTSTMPTRGTCEGSMEKSIAKPSAAPSTSASLAASDGTRTPPNRRPRSATLFSPSSEGCVFTLERSASERSVAMGRRSTNFSCEGSYCA